jgi:hypothetical protein
MITTVCQPVKRGHQYLRCLDVGICSSFDEKSNDIVPRSILTLVIAQIRKLYMS